MRAALAIVVILVMTAVTPASYAADELRVWTRQALLAIADQELGSNNPNQFYIGMVFIAPGSGKYEELSAKWTKYGWASVDEFKGHGIWAVYYSKFPGPEERAGAGRGLGGGFSVYIDDVTGNVLTGVSGQ